MHPNESRTGPDPVTEPVADPEADRIDSRAGHLLPEEAAAGSDDPVRQAAAILDESDQRVAGPDAVAVREHCGARPVPVVEPPD
ncbi:hypothetical protein ACN27F_09420 [Solwaraspora sp. WMMB335]|uniref:hypothetical protein n=1 Tax=Solwaraspora sp. WMMB335 TaxID=3404118 RepID=UPI003B961A73